jgi:hypothetical protein
MGIIVGKLSILNTAKKKAPVGVKVKKPKKQRMARHRASAYDTATCHRCPLSILSLNPVSNHMVGQGNRNARDVIIFPSPDKRSFESANIADSYIVKDFVRILTEMVDADKERFPEPSPIAIEKNALGLPVIFSSMFYITFYVKCNTGSAGLSRDVATYCGNILDEELSGMNIRTMLILGKGLVNNAYTPSLLQKREDSSVMENGVGIFTNYDPSVTKEKLYNSLSADFYRKLFKWYVCVRDEKFLT